LFRCVMVEVVAAVEITVVPVPVAEIVPLSLM
jgi:hypothetical protein